MNAVADVIGLSTSSRAPSARGSTPTAPASSDSATLGILPRDAKRPADSTGWYRARQRLGQLTDLATGWNGGNAAAPNKHTVAFAATELAGLEKAGIPAPTINPSADGAVYAEWHMAGIDLEVIFEAPYKIVALIEDARGVVPSFEADDPDLTVSLQALKVLRAR